MSQPVNSHVPDRREVKARQQADKAYRKAQRPWYKKKRFLLPIAFLVMFIALGALGSGGQPSTAAPAANNPPAFPGATPKDVVAHAGEAVDAEGLTVTAGALAKGDGQTLCAPVNYRNGRQEPVSFNGGFDWKLQDPHGAIVMTGLLGSGDLLGAGQVAPGGQVAGDICFTTPRGNPAGQYIVLYDPTFRFSSDRIAWISQR